MSQKSDTGVFCLLFFGGFFKCYMYLYEFSYLPCVISRMLFKQNTSTNFDKHVNSKGLTSSKYS